ncbi:hypothetical protein [Pseudomonas fluorescens]|uniref:hypothetical protein n=1 Tax=Pseudomonas fluorescens TaxID=294 RepID=UPI00259BA8CD|nr:hypothetical protein [Pseudomonas fluorescens]WJK09798.1 hypothetical protein QR290_00310 [Pseudomonas fluorescens]
MKQLLPLFMAFVPLPAHCVVTSENYCFDDTHSIKFELRTFYDHDSNWLGGFVKYAKSKTPISIVLTDHQEEILAPDEPTQNTSTWSEIVDGKITGTYEWITQAAMSVSMVYTNKSNGRKYSFLLNPNIDASLAVGCNWEQGEK